MANRCSFFIFKHKLYTYKEKGIKCPEDTRAAAFSSETRESKFLEEKQMEHTRDQAVKASFTSYLESAVRRNRRDFENKEKKRQMAEEVMELEQLNVLTRTETAWEEDPLRTARTIPWGAEAIRVYLSTQVSEEMRKNLTVLTDDESIILFAKVFRQLTFKEIGNILKRDWRKVASSYSYARKKLMKGWRDE